MSPSTTRGIQSKHGSCGFASFCREGRTPNTHIALFQYEPGPLVHTVQNTHWHQPLYLIFDRETMPNWFGTPNGTDLPSTFSIEYVRAWKHDARAMLTRPKTD